MEFDKTKIRDRRYREQFDQKLEEIKAVREKHTFIDYATNSYLFQELEDIYKKSLTEYQTQYEANLRNFQQAKLSTETHKSEMHRVRYKKAKRLYEEIEACLEVPDFNKNAEAGPLIETLMRHTGTSIVEFESWQKDLKKYKERLEAVRNKVWSEDYTRLTLKLKAADEQVYGDRIPMLPIGPDKNDFEEAIQARITRFETLKKRAQKIPRLLRKVESIDGKYYSRREFEKLEAEVTKGLNYRRAGRISLAVLIGTILLAGGYFMPKGIAHFKESRSWSKATETNTLQGYDEYLALYPEGKYALEAKKLKLNLDHGTLGQMTDAQGRVYNYEGEIIQALPNGKGIAFYENGASYDGYWKNGNPDSIGKLVFVDGSEYEGGWADGYQQGEGRIKFANGDHYEGFWLKDEYHGQGKFTWANGDAYTGNWEKGKQEGKGTMKFETGDSYTGDWRAGRFHGEGVYTTSEGVVYTGNWRDGKKEGEGRQVWPDGSEYIGYWKEGKRDGEGTLTWENGSRFFGEWKSDSISGQGTFVTRFRNEYTGIWLGPINRVTLYDGEGNVFKQGRFEGGLFIE